jgi:parvulin-like peptidyl-prolyl isomerase
VTASDTVKVSHVVPGRKKGKTLSQRYSRAVTWAAILGLLAGCGGGGESGQIVAEAGDIRITLAQLHDAYNRITPENRPDIATVEGRLALANDLLNKEIVLAEARRMGVDPGIEAAADNSTFQKALSELYRTEITDKVEVGGEDVQKIYEARRFNVKGSHVLVDDGAEAERILEEIRSGKISFDRAVEEYSQDHATREQGGRMGEIRWSMALPDFQLELFGMEPGQMKAFDGTIGGHVLRLDEKIPQDLGSPEDARQTLRAEARQQLEQVRLRDYLAELEDKAGLAWNDEGLDLCVELMRRNEAVDAETVPEQDRNVPVATDEERSVVIASFAGRDWTVGDYIDAIEKTPPRQRVPGVLSKRALRELIRGTQLRDELLNGEVYARGLDKSPAIQEARTRQLEQLMVDQVVYQFLQAAEVTEAEARARYDSTLAASPDAFIIPENVDLMLLVHTDSAVVAEGLARIRKGEDESAVIQELSVDFRSAVKGGRTGPITRGTYADELEDAAFAAEPGGAWSDPVVTPTGTGAFRVLDHQEARTATFDELRERITAGITRNRGELAFEEWIQTERERLGAVIHEDVLRRNEQPAP